MIPECEHMIKAAFRLEDVAAGHGWDHEAVLGFVVDTDDGIMTVPFPVQPGDIDPGSRPEVVLLSIANTLLKNTDKARERLAAHPMRDSASHVAGVWFIYEAFLADADKMVEVRVCDLLDCGGRLYTVARERGRKPDVIVYEPGSPQVPADPVVSALRRILVAAAVNMPDGSIDMEALAKVGTGDLDAPE